MEGEEEGEGGVRNGGRETERERVGGSTRKRKRERKSLTLSLSHRLLPVLCTLAWPFGQGSGQLQSQEITQSYSLQRINCRESTAVNQRCML
jgi:hypothetical protein